MFRNASWGAIGVNVGFEEGLELAAEIGFEGVDTPIGKAAEMVDQGEGSRFQGLYSERGLQMGPWGVPVNWRGSQEEFDAGLTALHRLAAAGRAVGATRVCTWVPPYSDELAYQANWKFHVDRFGPIAAVLAEHDCTLGLEFIGPKTLRQGHPHEFVHELPTMLELCAEIGPNVGLLLDAWHWYTAHGTEAQLAGLSNEQVVVVHVNDAPPGVPIDEQVDNVRCLPGATGVIDLACFMRHLARMGYDGPVIVEPFNQELREMEDRAAAEKTKASLDLLFDLAGVS
ncbi:MAG: sugar phosphate isomerase/epimerase [Armatimonadetes bacterium]|nr:sugar phosphate isomerase/epimerase [Armatimonadota bacterium]